MREIEVHLGLNQLARGAAEKVTELAQSAIATQGHFTVALSGGSTPQALFALLAQDSFAGQIAWASVHVFWGDERCVPPDHADSNYRLAYETLLRRVPIPKANIYRMQGELDPAQAAAVYEALLRELFPGGNVPGFDLILLGMGDDGHTASLFPDTAAIHEQDRLVVAHYVDKLQAWRITFTPVIINAADTVLFLVSGANKAERLKDVLEGSYVPDLLPAQIVQPEHGTVIWMVDAEAGMLLSDI